MFIFLVLIFILLSLIVVFVYLNKNNYYEIKPQDLDGGSQGQSYFSPDADYYTLKDSWKELTIGSIQDGQPCFSDNNCSSGKCRKNRATNQAICVPTTTPTGVTKYDGFTDTASSNIPDYGTATLYTAICAQRKGTIGNQKIESYYPDFKSTTLITENISSFHNTCDTYTFQQSSLSGVTCYDSDQLAGTKIVEMCQATPGTNQICINNDGDRVYSPDLNSLYIKPSLTSCEASKDEANTSINYISFNFNKVPQTIDVLESTQDGVDLNQNQLVCLSVDSVEFWPEFSIDSPDNNLVLTFTGAWGYQYSYVISGTSSGVKKFSPGSDHSSIEWWDTNKNVKITTETVPSTDDITQRLAIDNSYGITYNIPAVSTINPPNTFVLGVPTSPTIKFGDIVDMSGTYNKPITSTISLKPCAMFDSSYGTNVGLEPLLGENYVDKQKFKVSRFTMKKGALVADPQGMVSSIVYRNLNLYLDYYISPTSTKTSPTTLSGVSSGLVLRKINSEYVNPSRKWVLMPPVSLSPYTIPSGKNRWCNFSTDSSTDGGNSFNGKKGVEVPMLSQIIPVGTEIIDPEYNSIASQPDNKLFNAIGDTLEIGASLAVGGLPLVGYEIYEIAKGSPFHWQNVDPSFYKCANLCTESVTSIPEVKAVVTSSGKLGIVPPGHGRGVTQAFSQGDVLFGHSVGGVTCEFYYLYEKNITNNPQIQSMEVGSTFVNGSTNFVIESTYNNTYLFDTGYFNTKTVLAIKSISAGGSGYGKTTVNTNVINSFKPLPQKFTANVTSKTYSVASNITLHTCTSANVISTTTFTPLCQLNPIPPTTIPSTDMCTQGTNIGILEKIVNDMNDISKKWEIEVTTSENDSGTSVLIPLTVNFGESYCNNPTSGSFVFYTVNSIKPAALPSTTNTNKNFITLSKTDLDKYFPIITNNNITSFNIMDGATENYLFDDIGNKLSADVTYGNFVREYRLYNTFVPDGSTTAIINGKATLTQLSNVDIIITKTGTKISYTPSTVFKPGDATLTQGVNQNIAVTITTDTINIVNQTFITYVELTLDDNGGVNIDNTENVTLLSEIDSGVFGPTTELEVQEWWVMGFTYLNQPLQYQYCNKTATGCTLVLEEKNAIWEVMENAPSNILTDTTPLKFGESQNPISLLNSSVMTHGDSPQQIVYTGAFEDTNIHCYNTYNSSSSDVKIKGVSIKSADLSKDTTSAEIQEAVVSSCNADPKCSYDKTLSYCTGKDLIQNVSELYGDVFAKSDNFSPSGLFNTKEGTSHFTEITFLKSLQIEELNYQEYVPLPSQTPQGASPVTYFTPPEFLNYTNQNIQSLASSPPSIKLGKFIPYEYFYPTAIANTVINNAKTGIEVSKITTSAKDNPGLSANNFYINANYTQFIPYGKKSLYENGFTKQSDVPTF